MVRTCSFNVKALHAEYNSYLKAVKDQVMVIHKTIKKHDRNYDHWLLSNQEPEAYTKAMADIELRLPD